jgi:hypothetical protein
MKYRKFQTTIQPSGKHLVLQMGWVDSTRLDADMEWEKNRFNHLARTRDNYIRTVEVTDSNIVAVDESGRVRIVHWVDESGS